MKNVLIIGIIAFFLVACGEKYKTLTRNEKEAIAVKVLKGDTESKKEMDKIRKDILKAVHKGDDKAKKEDIEWDAALEMAENILAGEKIKEMNKNSIRTIKIN